MKTALIPPIPHLTEAKGREFHLVLAHLVELYQGYEDFYHNESQNGSYVILDNSAHEYTHGQSIKNLLRLAMRIEPKEIVIPDKLFDYRETVISACKTFEYLSGYYDDRPVPYKWMFVPQGNDELEWKMCLKELIGLVDDTYETRPNLISQGFTLGLSKDFEFWPGGALHLVGDHLIPLKRKYKCDIHLLGWGRDLWALRAINDRFGNQIRSTDSAKPYVYGMSEIKLDIQEAPPPYPKRSSTYFESVLSDSQLECSRHNVRIFDQITKKCYKEG